MSRWKDARNILVMRPDNIGDVIMLGPALRAIKETSPDGRLTLFASPAGAAAAPLLPWLDDVIDWRPLWQDVDGRLEFAPEREWELIGTIAEREFDAALIFTSFSQSPHVAAYVCYLAGIPLRAGESKEFGGGALSDERRSAPDEVHQAERNLRLVESLGFTTGEQQLAVDVGADAQEHAALMLRDAGVDPARPFVLLHPGASAEARRYPPERFARVAQLLQWQGWPVVVTGTAQEEDLIEPIRASVPDACYLIGSTPLATYAALVDRAALVICGNTLPMHLADAVGTPLVVPFSGTDYESQWRPRNVPAALLRRPTACHPCYRFECPIGKPCLDVSPDDVAEAAARMLDQHVAMVSSHPGEETV